MSDTLLVAPSRISPAQRAVTTAAPVPRDRRRCSCCSLVIAFATIKSPSFLVSNNGWRDLLLTPSILILLAVGQTVVIITRNVDLSVGSILALTAYLTGRLFIDHPGLPDRGGVPGRDPGRRAARPDQRRTGRLREGARTRHHARHPLHLPRHRALLGRQRPDQRRPTSRSRSSAWAPSRSCRSRCSSSSPSWCSGSWATTSGPPGVAASSTRSARTRTPPSSTASRSAAGCSGPSSSAVRSPVSPVSSTPRATAP